MRVVALPASSRRRDRCISAMDRSRVSARGGGLRAGFPPLPAGPRGVVVIVVSAGAFAGHGGFLWCGCAVRGSNPGDMGFDVMHLNCHKTFATPHGGGGPGSGPVAAGEKLKDYLPIPIVGKNDHGYYWMDQQDRPQSIGRLSCFMGNTGILLRAYAYLKLLGHQGLRRVSLYATLNANYLMKRLEKIGYPIAFPARRASHEFIVTMKPITQKTGVTALDVAKRLLDFGIHAPTIYFPLLIPECLLIEPTETESLKTLDHFVEIMELIYNEAHQSPEKLKNAPTMTPVGRLDEVLAAKQLDVRE